MGGAISYDEALRKVSGSVSGTADDASKKLLSSTIVKVREMHSSKFRDFANSLLSGIQTGDSTEGSTAGNLSAKEMSRDMQVNEYKKNLRYNLINSGVNEETAYNLVRSVDISEVPTSFTGSTNVTIRLSLGIT